MTADCPVGVRRRRVRRVVAGAVTGAGLMAGAWGLLFARMGKPMQGESAPITHLTGATAPPVMGSAAPQLPEVGKIAPPAQPAQPAPSAEPDRVVGRIAPHMRPKMGKVSPTLGE
jgi:hypothetical protein